MQAPDLLYATPGRGPHESRNRGVLSIIMKPLMNMQDRSPHTVYRKPSGLVWEEWYGCLAQSICHVHRGSEMCVGYSFGDTPR